jgi:glycosyltransferase involved in cell wall biosynthesis
MDPSAPLGRGNPLAGARDMNVDVSVASPVWRRESSEGQLRVLVASHSHPEVSRGGAEISAFRLFSELNQCDNIDAWFLGCNSEPGSGRDGIAITQPFGEREYVYNSHGQFDWFRMSNSDARLPREVEALLRELNPSIVHLHHYVVFGVEILWAIKKVLPFAKIVVTLHEYLAICNHFGQMVKTEHYTLCDSSSIDSCHRCFPSIDRAEFFIRRRYIDAFFKYVDQFIAPSQFLLERYAAWGLSRDRMCVIENIIAPTLAMPDREAESRPPSDPLRIGFFGQISKLKGIEVLLKCAKILSKDKSCKITFDIYGDYRGQPKIFQDEFQKQLAGASANVNYRGAYRQEQVDQLICSVDAVLVPSIWWENSPVVIQESLRNNRPVICSDIGGMAEKVRDKIDGFHFSVGNSTELSHLLLGLARDRSLLSDLQKTLQGPPKVQQTVDEHLAVYERLSPRLHNTNPC